MRLFAAAALLLTLSAQAEEVTFTDVPAYAASREIFRRMGVPPEAQARWMVEHPFDPAAESFFLHVPPEMPAGGYGLLVFVPPWDRALLPRGWERGLDRIGMIYVSAGKSGNEEGTLPRRVPLALTAAANVMKRFPVDPAHVYVGGFSGGSRVAERLALAYPDLFRGALLDAGSDRINDSGLPLPPDDTLRLFQEASRLVFVTGERDDVNARLDVDSMRSLKETCVFNFVSQSVPWLGHAVLPPGAFDQALTALLEPVSPDGAKLEECRRKRGGDAR